MDKKHKVIGLNIEHEINNTKIVCVNGLFGLYNTELKTWIMPLGKELIRTDVLNDLFYRVKYDKSYDSYMITFYDPIKEEKIIDNCQIIEDFSIPYSFAKLLLQNPKTGKYITFDRLKYRDSENIDEITFDDIEKYLYYNTEVLLKVYKNNLVGLYLYSLGTSSKCLNDGLIVFPMFLDIRDDSYEKTKYYEEQLLDTILMFESETMNFYEYKENIFKDFNINESLMYDRIYKDAKYPDNLFCQKDDLTYIYYCHHSGYYILIGGVFCDNIEVVAVDLIEAENNIYPIIHYKYTKDNKSGLIRSINYGCEILFNHNDNLDTIYNIPYLEYEYDIIDEFYMTEKYMRKNNSPKLVKFNKNR